MISIRHGADTRFFRRGRSLKPELGKSDKPFVADQKPNAKKKIGEEKDDIFVAPTLTREPTAKQVSLGGKLAIRVTATGRPMPSYQWYLNGKKISGATSDRYMVNKTRREHGGQYTCEVKNYVGRVMSRPAMISFLVERVPTLVIEPALAEIPAGKPFRFVVTGAPEDRLKKLNLQWTFNGKRINGAKGPELEFTEVKKKYEGEYKLLLFIGGEMRASNKVTLKVIAAESEARLLSSSEAIAVIPAAKPAVMDDFFFNPEDDADESPAAPSFSLGLADLPEDSPAKEAAPLPEFSFTPEPEAAPAEEPSPFGDLLAMPSPAKNRKLAKKKKLEAMLRYWQAQRPERNAA